MSISKELLSEILNTEITEVSSKGKVTIYYKHATHGEEKEDKLNIYYLAHKCKEWAIKKDYIIESSYESNLRHTGIPYAIARVYFDGDMVFNNYGNEFIETWHTEPEAIFKAAEWVYNNLKEKQ